MNANDLVDVSEAIATHLPPPFGTLILSQFKLIDALSGTKSETVKQQIASATASLKAYMDTLYSTDALYDIAKVIHLFSDWMAAEHDNLKGMANTADRATLTKVDDYLTGAFAPTGETLYAKLDSLHNDYFGNPAATDILFHGVASYLLGLKWQLQIDAILKNGGAKGDFATLQNEILGPDGWYKRVNDHLNKVRDDRIKQVVQPYRAEAYDGEVKGWTFIDQGVSEDTAMHMVPDTDVGPGVLPGVSPDKMSDAGHAQQVADLRDNYLIVLNAQLDTKNAPYHNIVEGWKNGCNALIGSTALAS